MMTSYVWVQTADDSVQQVEQAIAMFCPFICHEIHIGKGTSKNHAICLPEKVSPATLSLILDYCRFHQEAGHSNKERKSFDEKFMRMDTRRLCELASASDSLQFKPLVELTSRALARMIEGKTAAEIREIFCLPDDLTEEEKLEPVKNFPGDPRIRLLNRLYAKRRKELKERNIAKTIEDGERHVDDRSVDDLLSFINGGNDDSETVKTSKTRKKNRRRKEKQKNSSVIDCDKNCKNLDNNDPVVHNNIQPRSERPELQDVGVAFTNESDDEIDPVMQEQIDREVEDFTRRLSLNWRERMQELLYGQGRASNNFIIHDHEKDALRIYEQNRIERDNLYSPDSTPLISKGRKISPQFCVSRAIKLDSGQQR